MERSLPSATGRSMVGSAFDADVAYRRSGTPRQTGGYRELRSAGIPPDGTQGLSRHHWVAAALDRNEGSAAMPADDGLITRIFDGHVRFTADRTVAGVVAESGRRLDLLESSELLVPGCFTRSIVQRGPGRVKVLLGDRRQAPIGKVVDLRDEPEGLWAEIRFNDSGDADEALALFHADEAAIGVAFLPVAHRVRAGVVERVEVALRRLCVVRSASPAERIETEPVSFADPSDALRRLALASLSEGT